MSSFQQPIAHRLHMPIFLPLYPIKRRTDYHLRVMGILAHSAIQRDLLSIDMIRAIFDHYLVDPEARHWDDLWVRPELHAYEHFKTDMLCQGLNDIHRLIQDTTGPLLPSLRYRFDIDLDADSVVLTATLPTLYDYEQRIHEMANPDEGWIPNRFRR